MSPELTAALQPFLDHIHDAQDALDRANRDVDTAPLDCLAPAGRVIRHQADLIHRCLDLLDTIGTTPTETDILRIQGRINAAEALENHG